MDNLDLSILTNGKPVLNNREKKIVSEAIASGQSISQVLSRINHERTMSNKERKTTNEQFDIQSQTRSGSSQRDEYIENSIRVGTNSIIVPLSFNETEREVTEPIKFTNKEKKLLREAEVNKILTQKQLDADRIENYTKHLLEEKQRQAVQLEQNAVREIERKKSEAECLIQEKNALAMALEESIRDIDKYKKDLGEQILREKQSELTELSKQISILAEEKRAITITCNICFDEISQKCAINPCGHTGICEDCLKRLMTTTRLCPVCRSKMSGIIKTY